MYEQFFHFKERPFLPAPYPRAYVPVETMESAREQLRRAILRGEGPALLVGPPGTGKTLLLQVLAEECGSRFRVVFLRHGRFPTSRALLQTILHELKQPFQGMEDGELRIALMDFLKDEGGPAVVILADEADTLKLRLLEELRVLTNIQRSREPGLRLVLAGSPVLEERLTSPKLQTLNQRIAVRCYLDALNRADTFTYIRTQISRAGAKAEQIFPENALQAVYHATGGVPRLINQICDHALVLAFADGLQQITAEVVEEAWADLQQIPLPWNPTRPSTSNTKGVIEFGSLQDETPDRDLFSVDQGNNGGAEGASRFGFLEKPESPPSVAPHLDDVALSSSSKSDMEDGGHEIEAVSVENVMAVPNAGTSSSGEPALGDRPDPVTQIEQIEQAIQSLQEDPSPSAVKRPQAELIFYDWGDPFEETFMRQIPFTCGSGAEGYSDFEDDVATDRGPTNCVMPSPQNPTDEHDDPNSEFDRAESAQTNSVGQGGEISGSGDPLSQKQTSTSLTVTGSAPTEELRSDSSEGDEFPTDGNDHSDPETPPPSPIGKLTHPMPEPDPTGEPEAGTPVTLRFPMNIVHMEGGADKPQKYRAIMKSLFTRLGKSGLEPIP